MRSRSLHKQPKRHCSQTDRGRRNALSALGLVIGALVILGSAITFAAPDLRLSLERSMTTPAGLYAIAALRIAIGLVFVLAAPASRAPRTLRVLGLVVIVAGLATPWFGVARARAVLNWWASAGPLLRRLAAGVGMAIGGFLVYVFRTPTRQAT
jgi:NAD/NADP transhydrogenase beta subunit